MMTDPNEQAQSEQSGLASLGGDAAEIGGEIAVETGVETAFEAVGEVASDLLGGIFDAIN